LINLLYLSLIVYIYIIYIEFYTLLNPLQLILNGTIHLPNKQYTLQDILQYYQSITSCIHSFRRIFTHHYHKGHMNSTTNNNTESSLTSSSSSSTPVDSTNNTKRSRTTPSIHDTSSTSSSTSLSITLKYSFIIFINNLLQLLNYKLDKKHKYYSEDIEDKLMELQVLCLSTIVYFMVHSQTLNHIIQQNSINLSNDYLIYIYRYLLCSGGKYAEQLSSSESLSLSSTTTSNTQYIPPSSLIYTFDLSLSLQTLRQEFIDDYDDIRFASLRIIRDICYSKIEYEDKKNNQIKKSVAKQEINQNNKKHSRDTSNNQPNQSSSSISISDSFIGASEELLEHCHPYIISRNAAELLLNISLPLVEDEWLNSEHESYSYSQLSPLLQTYAQQHNLTLSTNILHDPTNFNSTNNTDTNNDKSKNIKYLSIDSDDDDTNPNTSIPNETTSLSNSKSKKKFLQKYMDYHEQRKLYGEAWLALLRLPLPHDILRRILLALPTRILPLFIHNQPLLLSDFLTDACNEGNANTLLALQSLFILMQQYGLEYPRFYPRLYALLTSVTATAKYRDRFFILLDLFLSSPALPVYLVGSFIKRLCRLALISPLGYAFFAIPAIYNLCKRHPSVLILLHRAMTSKLGDSTTTTIIPINNQILWPISGDPFNADTNDLSLTNAMASSLWEIVALQHHYHGPIATLARNFISEMTKTEYDISQYTGTTTTYTHIIKNECERTVRTQGGNRSDIQIPLEFIAPESFYSPLLSNPKSSSSIASKSEKITLITNDNILNLLG